MWPAAAPISASSTAAAASGRTCRMLAPHGRAVGLELEPLAAAAAGASSACRSPAPTSRASRFPTTSFDLAVSFDVLQVVEPDMAAVREMARIVRPGGRVVLTVAAFELLSGDHAEVWNEHRRYTPRTARELAESAGLAVERVSFAFASLFPLMLAVRTTQRLAASVPGTLPRTRTWTCPGRHSMRR